MKSESMNQKGNMRTRKQWISFLPTSRTNIKNKGKLQKSHEKENVKFALSF